MVLLEGMAPQGGMERRALPAPLAPLDPKVEGPSTPGGGRARVLTTQAQR